MPEHRTAVNCRQCGHRHRIMRGPAMSHWIFHCDRCGQDKTLGFKVLGAVLARAPLGAGPFDLGRASDREWAPGLRSRRTRLRERVEQLAGLCSCGGAFSLDAPPRCPQCGSDQHKVESGDARVLCD